MVNHKSKSSKSTGKPRIDPMQTQDDFELDIQEVIRENQVCIKEKLQPIFTAVRTQPKNENSRDDVARKYDVFLKSISQIMATKLEMDMAVARKVLVSVCKELG